MSRVAVDACLCVPSPGNQPHTWSYPIWAPWLQQDDVDACNRQLYSGKDHFAVSKWLVFDVRLLLQQNVVLSPQPAVDDPISGTDEQICDVL